MTQYSFIPRSTLRAYVLAAIAGFTILQTHNFSQADEVTVTGANGANGNPGVNGSPNGGDGVSGAPATATNTNPSSGFTNANATGGNGGGFGNGGQDGIAQIGVLSDAGSIIRSTNFTIV